VKYLVIGSLWLEADIRSKLKEEIHELRHKHNIGPEFKWGKVSKNKLAFYDELVGLFFAFGTQVRFRCIAVEHDKVDLVSYHNDDQELGFYKFYYQLIHHWISDFNEYSIFTDFKKNRDRSRLHVLHRCLQSSNLASVIHRAQPIESSQSVLVQTADVLTGAASAALNERLRPTSAKEGLVRSIEARIGRKIAGTGPHEQKFNVFQIDLTGGW
jgi:hypothetical protein